MAQRIPVEAILCESAEDLIDDFLKLAADGMTMAEIERFGKQLHAHLTRVDAYRHERAVIRSFERCGLGGEWARRETVRFWAAQADIDGRTPPKAVGARSRRLEVQIKEDEADAA
jgi:hypothetical protein